MVQENNSDQELTVAKPTVIIGAGTVGLLLAHALMKKGEKIVLIETGGDNIQAFNSNEYESIGHPLSGVSIGRTKGMGGTTNLWGGQLTEFIKNDIDEKNVLGQPSWPISWDELDPYYEAVYKELGLNSQWKDQTERLSSTAASQYLEIFHTRWLKQPNFKSHFLQDLVDSSLVKIMQQATVTNLSYEQNKCCSIEVNKQGNIEHLNNFKRVILANGTIEICRLLLISARSADCPYAANNFIGQFFQDHINLRVGQVTHPSKKFFGRFSNIIRNGEKFQPKIRINDDRPDKNFLGISGIFSFDSKVAHHLDNFKQFSKSILGRSQQKTGLKGKFKMFTKLIRATPQIVLIIYNYVKNNRIYVPFNSKVTLNIQAQQISNSNSGISLSPSEVDNMGRPKAIVNWQIDGREFINIRDYCLKVREHLDEHGWGHLQFEKWFDGECVHMDGSWKKQIFDSYHQAGGTIMSETFESGVVDRNLKIHETDNVYVCGASVMPTSSYANTTLTALALSLRLADQLSTN